MPEIIFNGKTYSSVEMMPPEIRQVYEQAMDILADKNRNGIPDILEDESGSVNIDIQAEPLQFRSTQFVVDGKVYSSVDELPPEARQKYEQAMTRIGQAMGDANQDGVPDILDGIIASPPTPPRADPFPAPLSPMPQVSSPAISEESSGPNWTLLGVGILIGIMLMAVLALGIIFVLPLLK